MAYFKNKPYPARGSQLPLPEAVRESLGIQNPSQNPQVRLSLKTERWFLLNTNESSSFSLGWKQAKADGQH